MGETHHDRLYKEACALIDGLILLDDRPASELTAADMQRLDRAISLFEEVVRINGANWPAMWLLGKVHQRLGRYARGLDWFAAAHRVNPAHPDVAREASIAAMDAGRPELAVEFCERAVACLSLTCSRIPLNRRVIFTRIFGSASARSNCCACWSRRDLNVASVKSFHAKLRAPIFKRFSLPVCGPPGPRLA